MIRNLWANCGCFCDCGEREGIDIFRVFPILRLLNTEQIPSAFLTVSMYLPIMPTIDYWPFVTNLFGQVGKIIGQLISKVYVSSFGGSFAVTSTTSLQTSLLPFAFLVDFVIAHNCVICQRVAPNWIHTSSHNIAFHSETAADKSKYIRKLLKASRPQLWNGWFWVSHGCVILYIARGEKSVHMTDCQEKKILTWRIVMWTKFSLEY